MRPLFASGLWVASGPPVSSLVCASLVEMHLPAPVQSRTQPGGIGTGTIKMVLHGVSPSGFENITENQVPSSFVRDRLVTYSINLNDTNPTSIIYSLHLFTGGADLLGSQSQPSRQQPLQSSPEAAPYHLLLYLVLQVAHRQLATHF